MEMGVGDGPSGQLSKYYQRGDSQFLLRAVLKILVRLVSVLKICSQPHVTGEVMSLMAYQ